MADSQSAEHLLTRAQAMWGVGGSRRRRKITVNNFLMLSQRNKEGRQEKGVAERREDAIRRGQRHSEEMKWIIGNKNKPWAEGKRRSMMIHKDRSAVYLFIYLFFKEWLERYAESWVCCPGTLQQPALFIAAPDSSRGDLHHSSLHAITMNY